jgi:superfamily I DNA/RNA helicase
MTISEKTKYSKTKCDRDMYVEAILKSESNKKVVVAGPGTGKTYLFKKILADKQNSLTLTFINSLVEDLSIELYGLSTVKTLHSFALSILNSFINKKQKISPLLSKIISKDAEVLKNVNVDFEKLFYNRDEENKFIEFYKERRKYYKYYGYTDIIFAAVKYFEKFRDKIPAYDQILVDEFQDFNKLEVSFIDLLAEKSPILLAGDDDQALYDFKSASTYYIRERHSDDNLNYESFNLPYCARCTRVVVDATNDIINTAKKSGFLEGRINKPYTYFDCKKKDIESESYSKIGYAQIFATQIPWFIYNKIDEMAKNMKSNFSVLIISPYKKQSRAIAKALKEKGLQNIEYTIKDEPEITMLDGIKLLLEDKEDNLGWRIVSKFLLKEDDFISLLNKTDSHPDKKIHDLIKPECKKEVKEILKILKLVKNNKPIDDNDFTRILNKINIDINGLSKDFLKNEINNTLQRGGNHAIRKIPIKAKTIQSSKGLDGDLVFITHFDNRFFIKDSDKTKITDQEICNFLVALSRTKRKVYLISSKKEEPTFLKWISKDRIETIST